MLNGQVTLGDVMATNTLHVENADAGATAQATAVGNVASAIGQDGDLSFTSSQRYGQGYMGANSSAVVDGSQALLDIRFDRLVCVELSRESPQAHLAIPQSIRWLRERLPG